MNAKKTNRSIIRPIAWTIGGSDPSSGAGIQRDITVFQDLNVYPCSVLTTITAQNSFSIQQTNPVDSKIVTHQISALQKDLSPNAIKLGALGTSENIEAIANTLKAIKCPLIVDPVLSASAGGTLLDSKAIDSLISLLFPQTFLLTPNLDETEKILNVKITTTNDIEAAAQRFLNLGIQNVLIKGGHLADNRAKDFFSSGSSRRKEAFWLQSPRFSQNTVHGTGCTLSTAITAAIALDYELKDALVIGKMYINQAIHNSLPLGKGSSLMTPQGWPKKQIYLPQITKTTHPANDVFPSIETAIGFYPIVDSIDWIKRLINQGVTCMQLRIKNQPMERIESTIQASTRLAKQHQIRLFINDYWKLAIQYNAYGIHLGQEDLQTADMKAIQASGLRLGISTHCFYEVAIAHAYQPSYIAFGPIYPTQTKVMKFAARGLKQLAYWSNLLEYPVVAIGGIHLDRLSDILSTPADGVSVISAVTAANDPEAVIQQWLQQIEKKHVKC